MFNPLEFIELKRDGGRHGDESVKACVSAVMSGAMPDYQLSAWLMAAYFRGLDEGEVASFTEALGSSGDVMRYPQSMHVVDKHSTGGVGDKTTLILAPLAASCGAKISKLSGPGLGFTGGTVDKLEAIPGINVHLSMEQFHKLTAETGCAISGHSLQLAPAEGRFYTLRDVTGTVPSIPLITMSILSKKLAGGAQSYLFDVKCGNGALMENLERAAELAEKLVETSKKLGKEAAAVITDMEQPLGEWVGNAAEVFEAVEVLGGGGPGDTAELCCILGGHMLKLARIAKNADEGAALCRKALRDGSALKKFAELIKNQGGDESVCYQPSKVLPQAARVWEIKSDRDGFVSELPARRIGAAVRALGGGRIKREDVIDHAVGARLCAKVGDCVRRGDVIIRVFYNTEAQLEAAAPYFSSCWQVSGAAEKRKLLLGFVG